MFDQAVRAGVTRGKESIMRMYYLQHWKVDALPEQGFMRCDLRGVRRGWRGQWVKHEEWVTIPLREHELVQETIRRATFASPQVWKVSLLQNLSGFEGQFYQPVPEQAHEREGTFQELDRNAVKGRQS
jgi:hypothetical protein